jgi:hypothetical protein
MHTALTRNELHQIWWQRLESLKLVKMEFVPEQYPDIDQVRCYCETEECETVHLPETIRLAERDGIWGLVGEYRFGDTAKWEHGDSVWGFIGTDENGYETNIQSATIDELRKQIRQRCRSCKGTGKKQ